VRGITSRLDLKQLGIDIVWTSPIYKSSQADMCYDIADYKNIETEYKDVETINYWKKCKALYGDDEERLAHGRKVIHMKARGYARTPIQ
jgi:hypothetical protein